MIIKKTTQLRGNITIPGDKSISHRSVMLGAIAKGTTKISGFLQGADCLATIHCFQKLGISIESQEDALLVHGKGLHGLSAPTGALDVKNSGTTARLLSGILVGQPFESTLSGDVSLNQRPMKRILTPLSQMGGKIESIQKNDCAPLHILQSSLHGIHYHSPIASAQVKSAILLAGLYAEGETFVSEPVLSRNHTELLLQSFGGNITTSDTTTRLQPCSQLYAQEIQIPGDISSAAYFIAAGLLVPDSELLLQNVGINPTRNGILNVCRDMGADITCLHVAVHHGEPTADLLIRTSTLHGTLIDGSIIPTLIDEIPIIAVLAACAKGETIIRNASELKAKETNRIETITENLTAMGALVTPLEDGMIIKGSSSLQGATIHSHGDHRIAMAFSIAGLVAQGETNILDSPCVEISYPTFYQTLQQLH
ncbi:MAG: 3-phosphoshikimate 1-carboxyvinyltransferase [Lachnospiraceae bacterium]